ncbi:hypothetical protein [Salirhabdus sp. Marseille-P4669]|uniref:hypothetical protein n=1 Tax=Salirhabdus sp. Marseille-P4669 TaxID=2042310 RepID=UPI000C7A9D61|nr:hypothetical protein [Salirhabdus sp. Marseille-P4669]
MANNPFQQLNVIRNASKKGKRIVDCYRLLYKSQLWLSLNKKEELNVLGHHTDYVIEQLKQGTFRFQDNAISIEMKRKLLELLYTILLHIYEPVLERHHCFDNHCLPNHQNVCRYMKKNWAKSNWYIRGDVQVDIRNLSHSILLKTIASKIKDTRFRSLIHNAITNFSMLSETKALKKVVNKLSRLLVNIYFIPLDNAILYDKNIRQYVRYHQTLLIGVNTSRRISEEVKASIHYEFQKNLCIPKQNINVQHIHGRKPITLGDYELKFSPHTKAGCRKLTITISKSKVFEFARNRGYGSLQNFQATHRPYLVNKKDVEIVSVYNNELKDFARLFTNSDSIHLLHKLFKLAEKSFIQTIALKRKSTASKVAKQLRKPRQGRLTIVHKDDDNNKKHHVFIMVKDLHFSK